MRGNPLSDEGEGEILLLGLTILYTDLVDTFLTALTFGPYKLRLPFPHGAFVIQRKLPFPHPLHLSTCAVLHPTHFGMKCDVSWTHRVVTVHPL